MANNGNGFSEFIPLEEFHAQGGAQQAHIDDIAQRVLSGNYGSDTPAIGAGQQAVMPYGYRTVEPEYDQHTPARQPEVTPAPATPTNDLVEVLKYLKSQEHVKRHTLGKVALGLGIIATGAIAAFALVPNPFKGTASADTLKKTTTHTNRAVVPPIVPRSSTVSSPSSSPTPTTSSSPSQSPTETTPAVIPKFVPKAQTCTALGVFSVGTETAPLQVPLSYKFTFAGINPSTYNFAAGPSSDFAAATYGNLEVDACMTDVKAITQDDALTEQNGVQTEIVDLSMVSLQVNINDLSVEQDKSPKLNASDAKIKTDIINAIQTAINKGLKAGQPKKTLDARQQAAVMTQINTTLNANDTNVTTYLIQQALTMFDTQQGATIQNMENSYVLRALYAEAKDQKIGATDIVFNTKNQPAPIAPAWLKQHPLPKNMPFSLDTKDALGTFQPVTSTPQPKVSTSATPTTSKPSTSNSPTH